MSTTRTRFAPSPTGALHAGTVRTALFAWLVARHDKGTFILRIEDTDQAREVEGALNNILESLKYLGLQWDEGIDAGGDYGPYVQSERQAIYKDWANKLIASGRAYADPYTKEELNKLRENAKTAHKPFLFRDHRPENPPVWDGSQPLRFKSDPKKYAWNDLVLGEMNSSEEAIDDFIIIKSDGLPTYNFAHIIDDHLMKITHVIRSQEFTSSVPRFLNLYDALKFDPPKLATVPQVLNDSGQKKLSKREGAKQILEYKSMGILPQAMLNFLATLGWNDGTTQEIYSVKELIEKFDISRVQKSGAKFDEARLLWINGHFIRDLDISELYELVEGYWPESAGKFSEVYKKSVLKLVQERLKYFDELKSITEFFFTELDVNTDIVKNNKQLKKLTKQELIDLLEMSKAKLKDIDFNEDNLTKTLNELLDATGQKPAVLFSLIRIATTNAPASPGLAESMSVLGKEVSLNRIDNFIKAL